VPRPFVGFVASFVGFGLLAVGCGGGGSPRVASVASPATATTETTTTTGTTTTTSTQSGKVGDGSSVGGSPVAPRGGGNHTVMMVGNAVQGTKFSSCMRTNGVSNFPDPSPQGTIQFGSAVDPRSPGFRSALHVCRNLLPSGFGPPTATQLAQLQQQLLTFSACMRAHGIKDFPDPAGGGLPQSQPVGDLDPNTPLFQTADNACKGDLPAGMPAKALGGLAPPA
jgi:hypothetical protein